VPGHRPGDVQGVLQRLGETESAVHGDDAADDDGGAVAREALGVVQLVADHGELTESRIEDALLQVGIALEDESEDRRQQQEEREERQEPVVRDQRREVRPLILGELVGDREGKSGPPVALLKPVEPVRHQSHVTPGAAGTGRSR